MDVLTGPAIAAGVERRPRVSVITAAFNAAPFIGQCVESILNQSFADLEMIVVDDASTDGTGDILAQYHDPRLHLVRNDQNLGVVGARNRAISLARGEFIAPFDADDLSMPGRIARQVALLDEQPATVMVGTATFNLENGHTRPGLSLSNASPLLLRWLLHVGNPFGHSTLLYRASAVRRLEQFLDDSFRYAEDFEFCHRMMRQGELAYLNERLVFYRRHPEGVSNNHRGEMIAGSIRVLTEAYRPWFGDRAAGLAKLVIDHLFVRQTPPNRAALVALGAALSELVDAFLAANRATAAESEPVLQHAAKLWWGLVHACLRSGWPGAVRVPPPGFAAERRHGAMPAEVAMSALHGVVPFKSVIGPVLRNVARGRHSVPGPASPQLSGVTYESTDLDAARAPTLYVVVDTEAEFDWNAPFDREQTAVTAMHAIERGQAVFDEYALKPLYVVDYAIASQPDGYGPLRAIHDRGRCELGVHLHPWITPPFEEVLSTENSYAGNLPADLERRKLTTLLEAFRASFGFDPKFFKSGRYGIGPNTIALLAEHGLQVDFSIIPGRDLSQKGGPDFRAFTSAPHTVRGSPVFSVPMTRGPIGPLSGGGRLARTLENDRARRMLIPGALSRLGLLETVTLTPEGERADKQVALIKTMLRRNERMFVLHYHSPSLAAGFTPYARTAEEATTIVRRLDTVCREFFHRLGGMPGDPQDFLPIRDRTLRPDISRIVHENATLA